MEGVNGTHTHTPLAQDLDADAIDRSAPAGVGAKAPSLCPDTQWKKNLFQVWAFSRFPIKSASFIKKNLIRRGDTFFGPNNKRLFVVFF